MTTDQWHAVTVNLGCGGPRASEYRDGVMRWSRKTAGPVDVVFTQEMPTDAEWRSIWADYDILESPGPQFRPRSAVIVRKELSAECFDYGTAAYHGSYVAAAVVGGFVLMSVHASPSRLTAGWEREWLKVASDLPAGRSCGRWDADLVLESVKRVRGAAEAGGVIAAGDWNEARGWDVRHPGGGGVEFFERVQAAGFDDVCCHHGDEGDPTHGDAEQGLHLDHVFVSDSIPVAVKVEKDAMPRRDWPADHRPVEFTIG